MTAFAASSQEACIAPCRHTTCREMSALGMNCGHLESLGCQCEGCCVAKPPREPPMPSAPPPLACDHACLASTCGALRHTLHCEEIEELGAGCECGGCCDPNPSPPPPSPATPSTASSTASLGKMISHTAKDRAAAGDFSGYVLAVVCACLAAVLVCAATACSCGAKDAKADAKADPLLTPSEAGNEAETKAKAKGVSVEDVCGHSEALCWSKACDMSGLSFWPAALLAAAKLLLWHWLQPAAYLVALTVYWGEIDAVSHWLGAIVGVREVIYVVLTLAALYVQPAYLLVGVNATLRQGNPA